MGKDKTLNVAAIQLNSTNDKAGNLRLAEHWVTEAYDATQPQLIALPEMWHFMGGDINEKKKAAESIEQPGAALLLLQKLAKKFKVYIHGGSICEFDSGHYFNTTCIFNPTGELIAKYRKINLFRFTSDNIQYQESTFLSPGNEVVNYAINNYKIGAVICFDIRFGQLFQHLIQRRVNVVIAPSAFTFETGRAHWEILLRARAIETQSFVIAPAETGHYFENNQQRVCYGHSLIIDPWGTIMAELQEGMGFISATLDIELVNKIRSRLPVASA